MAACPNCYAQLPAEGSVKQVDKPQRVRKNRFIGIRGRGQSPAEPEAAAPVESAQVPQAEVPSIEEPLLPSEDLIFGASSPVASDIPVFDIAEPSIQTPPAEEPSTPVDLSGVSFHPFAVEEPTPPPETLDGTVTGMEPAATASVQELSETAFSPSAAELPTMEEAAPNYDLSEQGFSAFTTEEPAAETPEAEIPAYDWSPTFEPPTTEEAAQPEVSAYNMSDTATPPFATEEPMVTDSVASPTEEATPTYDLSEQGFSAFTTEESVAETPEAEIPAYDWSPAFEPPTTEEAEQPEVSTYDLTEPLAQPFTLDETLAPEPAAPVIDEPVAEDTQEPIPTYDLSTATFDPFGVETASEASPFSTEEPAVPETPAYDWSPTLEPATTEETAQPEVPTYDLSETAVPPFATEEPAAGEPVVLETPAYEWTPIVEQPAVDEVATPELPTYDLLDTAVPPFATEEPVAEEPVVLETPAYEWTPIVEQPVGEESATPELQTYDLSDTAAPPFAAEETPAYGQQEEDLDSQYVEIFDPEAEIHTPNLPGPVEANDMTPLPVEDFGILVHPHEEAPVEPKKDLKSTAAAPFKAIGSAVSRLPKMFARGAGAAATVKTAEVAGEAGAAVETGKQVSKIGMLLAKIAGAIGGMGRVIKQKSSRALGLIARFREARQSRPTERREIPRPASGEFEQTMLSRLVSATEIEAWADDLLSLNSQTDSALTALAQSHDMHSHDMHSLIDTVRSAIEEDARRVQELKDNPYSLYWTMWLKDEREIMASDIGALIEHLKVMGTPESAGRELASLRDRYQTMDSKFYSHFGSLILLYDLNPPQSLCDMSRRWGAERCGRALTP